MRLTCPNCTAQYEVDDNVVPAQGRDVQCSACGHTWFQFRQEATGLRAAAPITPPPAPAPVPAPSVAPQQSVADTDLDAFDDDDFEDAAPVRPAASRPEPRAEEPRFRSGVEDDDDDDDDLPAASLPPRKIEPEVLEVLREEAEREVRQRQRDAGLETQPELGLEPAARPRTAIQAEDVALVQAPGAPAAPRRAAPRDEKPADRPSSRRDLLPDIEALSSTLEPARVQRRGAGGEEEESPAPTPARGRDFRRGLSLVLLVATTLTAIYVLAQPIGEAVPALSGPLNGYVGLIDHLRAMIAGLLRGN